MGIDKVSKWIYFEKAYGKGIDERKTEVWDVINKTTEEPIARIEWYSHWRQYVFFPEPNTVFDDGCLEAILEKIKGLNIEHKEKMELSHIGEYRR